MLNAIFTSTLTHRNLLKSSISPLVQNTNLSASAFDTYKFCWGTIESVTHHDHETGLQNIFYYFRECTQNDFVYMKFSSNCKICFRPNENCRLHRNLLKFLDTSVCVCLLKLMPTKFCLFVYKTCTFFWMSWACT